MSIWQESINPAIESCRARQAPVTIGTPAYYRSPYGEKAGHVAAIGESNPNVVIIGANGVKPAGRELVFVWEDGTTSAVTESIARDWLLRGAELGLPAINDAPERLAKARARKATERDAREAERKAEAERLAAFRAEYGPKIPANAKAFIVAKYMHDECDLMTDYFHSRAGRTIILAFSTHTRDLFPEMRKAARNHPETAHLADLPESAEHREKWSMGAGYYLKEHSRYRDGWMIKKEHLWNDDKAKSLPMAEWAVPDPVTNPRPAVAASVPSAPGAIRIEKHTHTKKGFDMWIAILPDRVDRDTFDAMRDKARDLGGWYSRPWDKTPGGFAFKKAEAAEAFASGCDPAAATESGNSDPRKPTASPANGDKFRALADAMQSDIDSRFADRLENTSKRQRQAAEARNDGWHMTRTQAALRALADAHDAGTVPPELAGIRTKKQVSELMRNRMEYSGGYYDAGRDTGEPASDTPETRALRALVGQSGKRDQAAEDLRRKESALQFANIPGYFPTPPEIVARMLDHAAIPQGEPVRILEPSAGSGAIWEAIRETRPSARVECFETWGSLRDILEAKGADLIGHDFLESDPAGAYDFVIMNPPFEKRQDIAHVRHAFDHLKPGGRLVAIMSPHFTYASNRDAESFREWIRESFAEVHDIPAGAFKQSGTGVATCLVIIDKES